MDTTAFKQAPRPITLEGHGVRLVPLTRDHAAGLRTAMIRSLHAEGLTRDEAAAMVAT